jgi:hypothetical protein
MALDRCRVWITQSELCLMQRFIAYIASTRPGDKIPADRYSLACRSYSRAEAAWLFYGIYRRHGIPLLCWYQNELEKPDERYISRPWPNAEWRPAIILRTVLASAGLYEETTGIPGQTGGGK